MTKKKVWQIAGICCLCVCVLMGSVLGVVFGMNHTSEPVNLATADTQDELIEYEMTYSKGIELFMSSVPDVNGRFYERTITAILRPAGSTAKVDWSLEWENPSGEFETEHSPSSYIEVVPDADGSTIATVICRYAFPFHNIKIVCNTRDGDYSAYCLVRFIGFPSSLSLNFSSLIDYQFIHSNTSVYLDVVLRNGFQDPFGSGMDCVTDEYYDNFMDLSVSYELVGTLVCSYYRGSNFDNLTYSGEKEVSANLFLDKFINNVEVVDGKIYISVGTIQIGDRISKGGQVVEVYEYVSGLDTCLISLTVTDNCSGVYNDDFKIGIITTESVELQDEILF